MVTMTTRNDRQKRYKSERTRTLTFGVDLQLGGGGRRFPNAIVSYALKHIVVPPPLNRFKPEDRAMRHVHNQVITAAVDALSSLAPVDVGGGVS